MRFHSTAPLAAPHARPPLPADLVSEGAAVGCGWYDSSFDLSSGLVISEQDNDTMYWLWALTQPQH